MSAPLRVLCLDIEGGYGGSSRSLFESVRHMDRRDVAVEVWCGRDGPIRQRYEAVGIPCRVVSGLPRMNSLPRFSRNVYGYARCLVSMLSWRTRTELAQMAREQFDHVHFNHEALFLLAQWLRRYTTPTMHVRTMIPDNVFGRWQCQTMAKVACRLIFITENERANVERLAGRQTNGAVIYNIAEGIEPKLPPDSRIPADARLKVAVLSNFAYVRGTDRVVDIAKALAARGRRDVLFVVAGDMQLRGQLPGELGEIAARGGTLADYAALHGVADMVLLLGHVSAPEKVLAGCDVLLKPTREANPWGRDILEGLASGRPVISVGTYDRFVENGATGYLLERYDADAVADILLRLQDDRPLIAKLGVAAGERVASLCNGPARAAELLDVWREACVARSVSSCHG